VVSLPLRSGVRQDRFDDGVPIRSLDPVTRTI
jgi:hypothetical protein